MKKMVLFILSFLFLTSLVFAQNVWINEIHYDNASTDVNEAVEVVLENPGDYTLSDFTVTPYNGNGGGTYGTAYSLDEFTVGTTYGNFVIYSIIYPANGLQNGAPDGIALDYQGTVVTGQFLSYEGVITATNGPANGLTSTDIGVSESSSTLVGESLQLSGGGSQYSHFTWQSPTTSTLGSSNNSQSFGSNALPAISNIVHTSGDITSSTSVSVSAYVTDLDGTISLAELHWGLTSGSLGMTISMSNGGSGDTYTTVTDIPAQSDGATVYYEIYAEDNVPESSTSSEQSYTVLDAQTTTIPYTKSFRDELYPCYTFSVLGATKEWYHNSGGYAACNGYNSGDTEEDWLILPGINLDNYTDENLVFDSWYKYGSGDDANHYLKLYYSTDYSGLGDPSSTRANWTELSFTHPSTAEVWTASGNVDLSGISGSMVYIAFKYYYESDSYRSWGIDNISITDDGPLPVNLSSFYALYIGDTPTVYWTTQSEEDNDYWNVYRGTNENFSEALHINANDPVTGNGTTNNASEYVYVDNTPVIQNTTYWYWIEDVSTDGETEVHLPITLFIPYEGTPNTPNAYGLHQNYPNPFNPSTLISFTLEEESNVELFIYNIKGEKIKEYSLSSNQTSIIWDGLDQNDQPVSSGVYFYKLITDTKEYQKKMLLVK